jgi:outer membrane protein OmpA-like peptidoglycan-associated protein
MIAVISAFAISNRCLPAAAQDGGGLQMLEPWQTVDLEHADRKNRLTRLANLRGIVPPDFYEYQITPAEHGLADYPTNIPVLRVVFRDGVLFDFGKDEVKPEALAILDLIAASLRLEPPDVTVFIAGHTDAVGSVDYNLDLGLRRARAVARALATIGVNHAQLFAVSFGKAVPIASNDSDDGRAQNRRVEFLFAARLEAAAAWLAKQPVMSCGRYASAQDCPTNLTFRAVSVSVALAQPLSHIDPATPGSVVPLRNPATAVTIGDRVVDIDLRQKVFHMRAPE